MSSRAGKRREKDRTPKSPAQRLQIIDLTEWLLRIFVLIVILALPWYFGSVQWRSQYLLAWVGICLCGCIAVHALVGMVNKAGELSVPWLTWLFFAVAMFAFIQSTPLFSWKENGIAPSSVFLQRWALGLSNAPPSLTGNLLPTPAENSAAPSNQVNIPCDLKEVPEAERRLAWSVEPLHTRAAVASLILCGLFVWLGRIAFTGSRKQLWLYGSLTAIGILIACIGVQGAVSYQSVNFLGLKSGGSFATFVSKNSAGGFYNICIAGCLGLMGWTLLNTQRTTKDNRYRFPDTNILGKIRGFAEDSLADLNTAQIAVALCLVSIVAALVFSLCRGAAVSALGAIVVASLISNARSRSRGSWVIMVAITTAFVASMVAFQVDDQAYSRLGSLSEIDLEDEIREGRVYIWSIAWKAMLFYGWLGSGLGTFHFAYLPFQQPSRPGWYYHAESLYAQCGVELGYIGISVLVLAIITLLSGMQRVVAKENWGGAFPSKLAGTYLIVSQALHSFVDFAIIIPALFVPACVLIGSVNGTLHKAVIAPARKRSRTGSTEPIATTVTQPPNWRKSGGFAILIAVAAGLSIAATTDAIQSLAISESMEEWTKKEEKRSLEEHSPDRVREIAELWAMDSDSLRKDPIAMRAFADALVYNYRMNQLIAAPPTIPWTQAWTNTSPVFLRLALDRTEDKVRQEQIIDSVGGKKALELLEKSSYWYALGQTKSPLDWRLLWGRCFTNIVCDRNEVVKLLPASLTLGKHNSQQLLASTVLFQKEFDQKQDDQILAQAIKSNIGTAYNSAKLLAMERKDGEIPIEILPPNFEVLRIIANETFTKVSFPKTHQKLWERILELVTLTPMTVFHREMWQADGALELGDAKGEIAHLRVATLSEPNNAKLSFRLAGRLLDLMDSSTEDETLKQVSDVINRLKRIDSSSKEAMDLQERVKNR